MCNQGFGWVFWANVNKVNFGRLLATSAAKCPHFEKKIMMWLFYRKYCTGLWLM